MSVADRRAEMTYKEIDRDLLIRKRRIAFELGESTLPKYAKKFIERVLDSEELTPTLSESEIRADERRKFIAFIAEHTSCRTDCENILNCDGKKCWNKYLDMYEKGGRNERKRNMR